MSDTLRTDAAAFTVVVDTGKYGTVVTVEFARELERELNALRMDSERYRFLVNAIIDAAREGK